MWWTTCKRYVKETRHGIAVNLGGGYGIISGKIDVGIKPEVGRLADDALLYLDIVQHYYCTQAKKAAKDARKARNEHDKEMFTSRQKEMTKKRDEIYKKIAELALKRNKPEAIIQYESSLAEYGMGITDKKTERMMEMLQAAYRDARPFLIIEEKGLDTGGGSITSKGPVAGKVETGGGDVVFGDKVAGDKVAGDIIIHDVLSKEEMIEAIQESGLAQPIPVEKIREQIEDYEKKLAQKELERERERLKRAVVLSVRGTERLEAKNYEGALEDLEAAIGILPENTEAWASANFNLGLALGEFPRGDREANLRKAIESYKRYLSVYTKDRDAVQYAAAQNNLGIVYSNLAEVRDSEENLQQAIEAYKQALRVYTFEKLPQDYAMTQNNLGTAYGDLAAVRDMEKNLEKAIEAYEQALRVYTFEKFPQDFAMTQSNLGNAYADLAEVRDRDENLDKAIEAHEQALRVYTVEKFPQGYAMTQNNLGTAYWSLSEVRDREENLKKAIEAYEQALRVYTFEKFPQYYAGTQNNLGLAYSNLAQVRGREENLRKAIEAFEQALSVYTFEKFPQGYAMTQSNLGTANWRLSWVRDKEENLDKAIEAYKEALKVRKKETLPLDFTETSYNLAITLNDKGDKIDAIKMMEEVLPVAEKSGDPRLEHYRRFYEELKSSQ